MLSMIKPTYYFLPTICFFKGLTLKLYWIHVGYSLNWLFGDFF